MTAGSVYVLFVIWVFFPLLFGPDEGQMFYAQNDVIVSFWSQGGNGVEKPGHLSGLLQPAACQNTNGLYDSERVAADALTQGYWQISTSQVIPGHSTAKHTLVHTYFQTLIQKLNMCIFNLNYYPHTTQHDVFLFLSTGIIPSFEYYKLTNMRPPFTYASMIRWVSIAE